MSCPSSIYRKASTHPDRRRCRGRDTVKSFAHPNWMRYKTSVYRQAPAHPDRRRCRGRDTVKSFAHSNWRRYMANCHRQAPAHPDRRRWRRQGTAQTYGKPPSSTWIEVGLEIRLPAPLHRGNAGAFVILRWIREQSRNFDRFGFHQL